MTSFCRFTLQVGLVPVCKALLAPQEPQRALTRTPEAHYRHRERGRKEKERAGTL